MPRGGGEESSDEAGARATQAGQRLRLLRTAAFLTQERLAESAGMSTRAIQFLEAGRSRLPHLANRERLAHALNLDAATARWLFLDGDLATEPPAVDTARRIIGRDALLAEITGLLDDPATRLLTLTGPGGVGKTSIAEEITRSWAAEGRGAATFVPLADLSHPDDILPAIAAALGIPMRDQPVRPLLARALADAPRLLLVDNLEHLLAGGRDLAWLLDHAPGLTMLATSREALHLQEERVVAIEPLDAVSADGPAVQLFLRRAAHGRPGFTPDASERSAILNLCQRLDGLPLAIELAAAQVQVLSPSGLLTLFEGVGLRALADGSRDGPERFATMNAAIDWSWQRLNPFDQQLLRCASIFAGGFTGEAVGAVLAEVYALDQALATLDAAAAIPRLLRANLLRVQPPRPYDDAPRFVMLEPIRLFAADHLRAAGEFERTSAAHARWIEGRLHDLDMAMTGPQPSPWLDRVEREYPNARAAIDRAIAAGDAEIASTLIGYVAQIWQYRDHRDEAMGRIDRVLVLPDLAPEAEAMLCFIGADVAYRVRDLDRMRVLSERLLALSLEQGLKIGHAGALLHLSMLAPDEPDRASAIALIREAQAVIAPDIDWTRPFLHGWAALRLGIELHRAGELPGARAELERAAARQAGKPGQVALAGALGHLGLALADLGEPRAAAQAIAADIPSAAALGDRWMVLHLGWWLLAVTLPHAGDKRAKKACASLLASLEAEARGLAEIMSPAEEAAIAPYRERLPVPPAVPLPLTEAVVAVMDLAATLPERAAPQGSGRLELPSLI